jgi:nucleotide-binding universal stress UspA family protein
MFEKVLLPLDGSELAETAIPYVRDLAVQLKAEVSLIHVCPPEHATLMHMHKIYLDHMADSLREEIRDLWGTSQNPVLKYEVITGEPAKTILEYVQRNSISLVAVTTAGASGIRAWAMGSVADKVVRGADIPTLLIRVKAGKMPRQKGLIKRILLPIDPSEASKIAVPYAADLAKKLEASITLFSMAQTIYSKNMDSMGVGVGVNWDAVDKATEKYTNDYLQGIENELKAGGIDVNHVAVLGIDAANEILELEKKIPADLVVMATRGRSPVARWAFGSVAEKILREGENPLLVIRQPTTK